MRGMKMQFLQKSRAYDAKMAERVKAMTEAAHKVSNL